MDDDDDFLYGGSVEPQPKPTSVPQPISLEKIQTANDLVANLENEAETTTPTLKHQEAMRQEEEEEEDAGEDMGEESEEEDEDDIEFIMEPQARSLDFRNQASRPPTNRIPSSSVPTQPKAPQSSLLTEYTPMQRGGIPPTQGTPHPPATPSQQQPPATPSQQQPPATPSQQQPPAAQPQPTVTSSLATSQPAPTSAPTAAFPQEPPKDDGIDTSKLPPVTAPPSHPDIDPTITGILDGRSILEVDLSAMGDKPWRRPGSDISDWFNYGFDEISWEAYCYRRRDLGELANVLKTNVVNFAGMPEDQLNNLPPEARQMVMTGTMAMMNGATPNPAMMPGVMMDMSIMGPMGMPMGMNGDMGMGGPMMGMQDGGQQQQGVVQGNGTPEQGNVGMMQQEFNPAVGGGGMMNMGMGEYGMQDQNAMAQQMYQPMETPVQPQSVTPVPSAPAAVSGRGGTPVPGGFRGRGIVAPRGRGFGGRGRGRGGLYGADAPPPPVRPASPLPPGVPTGPRNQNKYKDRDGNAPAVDGLDYGGGGAGRRTPSGEPEDRSSRKRRSSPSLDEGQGRSSKRR
ncbi:hypothetical protein BDQ12DRAFT_677552 [Crucibulum laeve]|uniref:Pre-mRNA polyadenylation factor Fip1 domain-containing protein n=1 Tax=Crucibulum laeve TaxID=68775 RepID=A0A5C3MDW0_9AGAR|nr:hypothetical protein BDQ12DRAFT_677552 [Crucibulum laeve]